MEISIKYNLGQLELPEIPSLYIPTRIAGCGLTLLDMSLDQAIAAGGLPIHHKDPFDRMLIAQAQVERLPIVTRDKSFTAYDVELCLVKP